MDHHHDFILAQTKGIGLLPVYQCINNLQFNEVIAGAGGTDARIANNLARSHQRFRRMLQTPAEFIECDAASQLATQAISIHALPQALGMQQINESCRPRIKQGSIGLRAQRHITPIFEQHAAQARQQGVFTGFDLLQREAGGDQAHATVDIGTWNGGNHEVFGGSHDTADRRNAAGMKIRRGARLADMPRVARHLHRGKRQELTHGFLLERESLWQQHASLCMRIGKRINAVLKVYGDTLTAQGLLQTNKGRHESAPEKNTEAPAMHRE